MLRSRISASLAVMPLLVFLVGCGGPARPPLGYVSGTVTMDGANVENILVVMKPQEGRMAMAKTDANGFYDIEYTDGEKGTKVGPTTVHVEWPTGVAGDFVIPKSHAAGTSQTKLDVASGRQTYNIEMESDPGQAKKKPVMVD